MRTVIRNSYTPKLGDYCNALVVDKETGNQYLFDKDGVWTLISTDEEGIVAEAVAQANAYTDDVAEGKVDKEEGKGLSENDFTDEDKDKLDGIEDGAQENVIEVIKRNGATLPITDKAVDVEVPTATSALTNDSGYITNTVDNLVNYYDKDETDTLLETEALTRDAADQDLQEQIDAIAASSDVVDIVGTYAELQAYDTTKLHDNDIIKVLTDSTHDDATTYYRWGTDNSSFSYIGSEGPYYTKGEADATFVPLTRTINGKGLNSDVVLTAADVNALPASTVIPTVNDATLTIQKNGSTVTTFTANSAQNATADITVPTKVSDITNDLNFVEEADLADVAFSGDYADLTGAPTIPTKTSDLTNDSNFVSDANYVHTDNNYTTAEKNKLAGIAAGAEVNVQSDWTQTNSSADDYIKNKPTIPTKTSDLTNDSGFITSAAVPTKTSDLTNDSGFITNQVSNLANYYDQTTINNMFNALPAVPTKTSDLTNDSGFLTTSTLPIATTSSLGVVKIGNGLSIAADGTLSSSALQSVDWADITGKPTNVSYWTNDAGYITSASLPTKTSDLTNDSGFITSASLPTKTSDLTNDSGFITNAVSNLTNYYTKSQTYTQGEVNSLLSAIVIPTKTSDLTNDGADGTSTYVEADGLATVATSGSYNDLSNKPTIGNATLTIQRNGTNVQTFTANATSNKTANITVPTKTSDLTNDSGFLTSTNYATSTTGGVVKVGSGLEITNGVLSATGGGTADAVEWDNVLNKPTFATVATSGSYNDLSNKPTIPTVNDATLTITQNGTSVGTFTANASSNKTIALTDTTYSNATTSAAGLMSSADKTKLNGIATGAEVNVQSDWSVTDSSSDAFIKNKPTIPTVNNGTLTIQKNGTNVQTFTANQSSNATANITVPTKTSELTNDSNFVTSSGTVAKANELTTPRTIAISGGATGTATSFNGTSNISIPVTSMYETYLNWGNQVKNSSVSLIDAAMGEDFSANRLAFINGDDIVIEYSTDAGATWTTSTESAATKTALVTTSAGHFTGGSSSLATGDARMRITITPNTRLYMVIRKLLLNISTNGVNDARVLVEKSATNSATNFTTIIDTPITGWSGWNSIPFTLTFGGKSQYASHAIRMTFYYDGKSASYPNAQLSVNKIRLYGETAWSAPSGMANNGHLYAYDAYQNATFPANVKVTGSLQHGSYTYTLPNKNGTVAMTSDIPSVPTVNNGQLAIQKNGSTVATFTANQSGNATANITVPTTVAELSDAGNYATNAALNEKQDTLTAGSHISISNDTISATGYVHSENPVTAASSTATVTGSMIADGSITADKLASGATIKLTLSTTDIGEGAALAANTLYGVYQ